MSEWLDKTLDQLRREGAARDFQEEVFGEIAGWPLIALTRESPGKETVYLSTGIHGDEPAAVEALLRILQSGVLDDRFSWRLCPVLNPTGLSARTRENAEGCDLNRDYLKLETEEVRAHHRWLSALPAPAMMISLHEDWESTGFYYYEISLGDHLSCYRGIRKAAEQVLPMEGERVIDDHATREPGWIFHPARPDHMEEWPEAIFVAEQGCPRSFTLETPSSQPFEDRVACHLAVVRYLLEALDSHPC